MRTFTRSMAHASCRPRALTNAWPASCAPLGRAQKRRSAACSNHLSASRTSTRSSPTRSLTVTLRPTPPGRWLPVTAWLGDIVARYGRRHPDTAGDRAIQACRATVAVSEPDLRTGGCSDDVPPAAAVGPQPPRARSGRPWGSVDTA
jgi:hypothetical protein